jgi:hypothetical protein
MTTLRDGEAIGDLSKFDKLRSTEVLFHPKER